MHYLTALRSFFLYDFDSNTFMVLMLSGVERSEGFSFLLHQVHCSVFSFLHVPFSHTICLPLMQVHQQITARLRRLPGGVLCFFSLVQRSHQRDFFFCSFKPSLFLCLAEDADWSKALVTANFSIPPLTSNDYTQETFSASVRLLTEKPLSSVGLPCESVRRSVST